MPDDASLAHDIVNTRVFPAPRARLFHAFRDPAALAVWWGPKGFTNTFQEFDFRVGGAWRFTMHGPNGEEYPNAKAFTEIVEDEVIAFDHMQPMHSFSMRMTFADEGAGTRVTWRMRFQDPDEAAKLRGFIRNANEENFDRLAAHLTHV